jgi:1-acyl-sn-glycerol-3-phosphate acyltransferase
MQEARKNRLIDYVVTTILKNLVYRFFADVKLRANLDVFQNPEKIPTIYVGNHSSRWDHHFGLYVTEKIWRQESYLMVAEGMMEVYNFLKFTGCYSISNSDPIDAARSLKYTKELLETDSNRVVWIYPQGIIKPLEVRPLGFQNGLGQLIRMMDRVRIVPVATRYEFGMVAKAYAYISFGKPLIFSRDMKLPTRAITDQLQGVVTEELDRLKSDVIAGDMSEFVVVEYSKGLFWTRLYSTFWQHFFYEGSPIFKTLSRLNGLVTRRKTT